MCFSSYGVGARSSSFIKRSLTSIQNIAIEMFGASSGGQGLFGSSNQQKPALGTASASFSFGSSNTNPTNNAFGANSNNASTLGNNTTQGASTGLGFSFGGSTAGTLAFGASKPSGLGGGLFGGASTANNSSTNTFGNTAASTANQPLNSNNAFGATSTSGGLFGKPAASTTAPSFGTSGSAQPATLGGLFGNKPAAPTGGLFGGSTQSTGTGLFGSNNTNGATQGTQTGGLFSQPGNTGSGGLFGTATNQTQNQLPGQNINQSQTNNAGSLFGGNSNNPQPSFGWSNNQLGNANGPSALSTNLQLNISTPAQTQKSISNYTPAINDQIVKLKEQWDPNSTKCALKTYIYNRFSEQEIAALLQQPRPANENSEDWENAMAHRPSALHYPVKVASLSEVAQRIEVQLDHVAKSRVLLNKIYEQLNQLSSKHDLDNTTRILKAKVRHAKLSRRLLRLATVLAVLKLKGYPMLPEEEEMSKQFQTLNTRLNDPNGPSGKLSDLYARLAILKSRSEDMSARMESSIQSINGGLTSFVGGEQDGSAEAAIGNEHIMNQLTKLLYKQQVGLSYLNDVVEKDLEKVNGLK